VYGGEGTSTRGERREKKTEEPPGVKKNENARRQSEKIEDERAREKEAYVWRCVVRGAGPNASAARDQLGRVSEKLCLRREKKEEREREEKQPKARRKRKRMERARMRSRNKKVASERNGATGCLTREREK